MAKGKGMEVVAGWICSCGASHLALGAYQRWLVEKYSIWLFGGIYGV